MNKLKLEAMDRVGEIAENPQSAMTERLSDAMIEAGVEALRGFTVKDDEGWGWPMNKAEREKAARRAYLAMRPHDEQVKALMELIIRARLNGGLPERWYEDARIALVRFTAEGRG